MTGSEERLVKFLSAAGVASRRAAGDLVKAGRIAVNGRTIREPGFRILPADTVTLDGRPVEPAGRFHYIMLNKPRGYVCTNADPHAPRKAVDLIRLDPPVRLFSAGRLDKESEGMILFSNDGDYVARLTHPRYEIRKTYLVRVTREFTEPELTRIRTGITDGGEHLRVISIAPAGESFSSGSLPVTASSSPVSGTVTLCFPGRAGSAFSPRISLSSRSCSAASFSSSALFFK